MDVTGSGKKNKIKTPKEAADFIRYCDSIVERALEAFNLVMKNRANKPGYNS